MNNVKFHIGKVMELGNFELTSTKPIPCPWKYCVNNVIITSDALRIRAEDLINISYSDMLLKK